MSSAMCGVVFPPVSRGIPGDTACEIGLVAADASIAFAATAVG
jgi:hypothetical protein